MPEVAGKGANVIFDTDKIDSDSASWSLNYTASTVEVTDFDDGGRRTHIKTVDGWTGQASGTWEIGNTALDPTNVTGTLATLTLEMVDGADYFSGSALITELSVSAPIDGVVSASFSFRGSGVLAQTLA